METSKPSITNCPSTFFMKRMVYTFSIVATELNYDNSLSICQPYSGGYSVRVPPLPIPNREVKLTHADGTAYLGGRVGSRLFKGRSFDLPFLFLFVRGIRQTAESLFYFVNGR